MFIMLAAGHETTATQLAWTLLELAQNPDLTKRLQEEVDTVLPNKRKPTHDDFEKLKFLNSCVKESLRLHPPVTAVPKKLEKPFTIAGYKLPKDTFVWANIHAIHRDPEYWPEPEKYNPDRFYDETLSKQIHPLSYLPFSGGLRKCIGFQFSYVESCMILARFAQFFSVSLPDGVTQEQAREETPFITLKAKNTQVVISRRN
jgi:cytochrome P450